MHRPRRPEPRLEPRDDEPETYDDPDDGPIDDDASWAACQGTAFARVTFLPPAER